MDRYKYIKKLGEGSYGSVFKAEDTESKAIVTLKEVPIIEEKNAGIDYSTLREIGMLKLLSDSSHIVQLKNVIKLESKVVMVLEYFETDLKDYINTQPLPHSQIQKFMYQLLKGVADCHKYSVLHRDLNPKNLLIDAKKGILKIADFGLGRPFINPNQRYTNEIGTTCYVAPELLLETSTTSSESSVNSSEASATYSSYSTGVDIWSAGCIFTEMSTGKVLVEGVSEGEQLAYMFRLLGTPTKEEWPGVPNLWNWEIHPKSGPQDLARVVPLMGPDGVDLLMKMLTYDPAKRISARGALRHRYFDGLDRSQF